jgi:hypothetical protein
MKKCILYDRECIECNECTRCDLNPNKVCDNCCKCLGDESVGYRSILIDAILEDPSEIPD